MPQVEPTTLEELAAKAERLRSLHRPGDPLVLPNVWDAVSARAVEAAGFPAVATSSHAVAEALGLEDGERAPVGDMLAAAQRAIKAVAVPVTVDFEAGYGLAADELVRRLVGVGAAGCNLEDSDRARGHLRDIGQQAAYLAAARSAATAIGVNLVINARVDVFLADPEPTEARMVEAIERARRYLAAGADCVFPIRLADERAIGVFVQAVGAPVNVYLRPEAPPIGRLAELGVARVSMGGWLQHLQVRSLEALLHRIAAREDPFPR